MICLTREIRCCLIPQPQGLVDGAVSNSWGGWPSASDLAPYITLQCSLSGEIDGQQGYLCNVKEIDERIRRNFVVPAADRWRSMNPLSLARFAFEEISKAFSDEFVVSEVMIKTTPTLSVAIREKDSPMLRVTQQFEFSASHRLHNSDLSDEENLRLYGKCNNPLGHGHNYVVDVTVTAPHESEMISLTQFEQIVKQQVIDRLDHKYLNIEVEQFHKLNPSVENIAVVIWRLLENRLTPSVLDCVRVYETPKTWADYGGP